MQAKNRRKTRRKEGGCVSQPTSPPHLVVMGGGITGLCAALSWCDQAKISASPIAVTICESTDRWGGRIDTLYWEGCVLERGPDSFLARKKPIVDITNRLGMEAEWVAQRPTARQTWFAHQGKLVAFPHGVTLGIPLHWDGLKHSPLVSNWGKMRAFLEPWWPQGADASEESLGRFLRRRFGHAYVEAIVDPLLSGIYAGRIDDLSIQATFPQFREALLRHKSVRRGMKAMQKDTTIPRLPLPAHVQDSVFLSYRHGLRSLVERLTATLHAYGVQLRLQTKVTRIARHATGRWAVHTAEGAPLQADAVIVTTPAPVMAKALAGYVPSVWETMPYASVAQVLLVYPKTSVSIPLNGAGFIVPRKEKRLITACTWTSSKWAHTATDAWVVLRCYVGRIDDVRWMHMDDATLVSAVQQDIVALMGIDAPCHWTDVCRMLQAMPQYTVGHVDRIVALRHTLETHHRGIYVAGASYEGVGIPDCIAQGERVAQQAWRDVHATR